jgi:hypothetical protein
MFKISTNPPPRPNPPIRNEPRYLQGHELERFLASPYCPDYIRAHPERYEVLYLGGTDLQ